MSKPHAQTELLPVGSLGGLSISSSEVTDEMARTGKRLLCFHTAVGAERGVVRQFLCQPQELLKFLNLQKSLCDQRAGRKESVLLKATLD